MNRVLGSPRVSCELHASFLSGDRKVDSDQKQGCCRASGYSFFNFFFFFPSSTSLDSGVLKHNLPPRQRHCRQDCDYSYYLAWEHHFVPLPLNCLHFNKLTLAFPASVLLSIKNFVRTLSKYFPPRDSRNRNSLSLETLRAMFTPNVLLRFDVRRFPFADGTFVDFDQWSNWTRANRNHPVNVLKIVKIAPKK